MIEIDLAHPTYDPIMGTPLYWRDEQTGVLSAAMMAYVNHGAWPKAVQEPTPEQLTLVIAYLRYVINAPCWRDNSGTLERLRADPLLATPTAGQAVETLTTMTDVRRWIRRCLPIGIDPL